jgi:FKBP-type peptidyl-prolyl cis-trans isomerase FkpA
MNNIFKILSVFVFCVVLASCSKTKDPDVTPLRDYATQYADDLDSIDQYIDTHYLTYDTEYNVSFDTLLPTSGHSSIRAESVAYHLSDTTVVQNGINYKVYFIKFREGDILNGKRPTQVDSVNVSYRGIKIYNKTKNDQFDISQSPTWFKLQEVISGWSHIIPNFHTGTYTPGTGGNPTTFNNFGAGVMFLPSALAYYNNSAGTIPAYTPIAFSFKLYELHYRDHDADGILSKDERTLDPTISPLIRWKENPAVNLDYHYDAAFDGVYDVPFLDTDGDGIPNMYDTDDDGDNYTTKSETVKAPGDINATSTLGHYPFNPTATEPKGIPARTGTVGNYIYDYTSPTRLRKHLDSNWNPSN